MVGELRSFAQGLASLERAKIFDFGAGPGCGAAGVCKFLLERGAEEPHVVLFDPVRQWEPATRAYKSFGVRAQFECCPNLKSMVEALAPSSRVSTLAQKHPGPHPIFHLQAGRYT